MSAPEPITRPLLDGVRHGVALGMRVEVWRHFRRRQAAIVGQPLQRRLRRFLTGPDAFQLFVDNGTDLRHVAQTHPFGER